jgi:hypothetical protein
MDGSSKSFYSFASTPSTNFLKCCARVRIYVRRRRRAFECVCVRALLLFVPIAAFFLSFIN